jgi:soluble lytic murein transglycosylase-like protein
MPLFNPRAGRRRCPARLADGIALSGLLVLAGAADAEDAMRYRCVMPDGSTLVIAVDTASNYGSAGGSCTAVILPASGPQHLPRVPDAAPVEIPAVVRSLNAMPDRPSARATDPLEGRYSILIRQAAQRYRLDPRLVGAVAFVESRQHADARSPKGALGVMQVEPATGARYGVYQARMLFDPEINIDVGAHYLNDLLDQFNGRVDLALAAYNAGENAVQSYGNRVPPFRETRRYVRDVLATAGRAPASAKRE